MIPQMRMLDANANRAREAMRVMEDAARFTMDDAALAGQLKGLRHDLRAVLETMCPPGAAEANRDTPGDVGTRIRTESEQTRTSLADVVIAAGKRLGEALRVIEEIAKVINAEAAPAIERLRYRSYELEHQLQQRLGSGRAQQWRVCVLLTESLCRHPWREVVMQSVRAGADCIQVREKQMSDAALLRRARDVIEIVRIHGVSAVVNDRPDLALLAGADGVHLGQGDLPIAEVRRLVGRQLIIGISTSNLAQARQAQTEGADYCGVGPMFATMTKHKDSIAGPEYLREFVDWGKLPHLAIGGITPENVHELTEVGCGGVAVSSAVCGSESPGDVVADLVTAMTPQRQSSRNAIKKHVAQRPVS